MITRLVRLLIIITCYGLSGWGAIAAIFGLTMIFSRAGLLSAIVFLVWLSAISALFQMSVAWVINIRLGAKYSRRARLYGISALFVIPIASLPQAFESHYSEATVNLALLLLMEVILVLPAILLAAYLNRFHASGETKDSA
ncbi:MAG: hypothetical protein M0R33_18330 [Methylomonas sp.]|jgi:hypothetical protein|uniref:hypothetical protein n=1 Tax=Methylomonas sp. TaxID=418 RepID=UPI0025D5178F|nr:hypothetical protein [Methylomonas sp.]MCK9608406.1 hypothetical protein [Methylomonas sp.]